MAQTVEPQHVVVVDASSDDVVEQMTGSRFAHVLYVRNPMGRGTTATSRRIGVENCSSDIIAFLDDDAYPEPDWLERLVEPYSDLKVGVVGGRALNGITGESEVGDGQVGLLRPDGTLTGNFSVDTGRVIVVDHVLGANMSIRRSALMSVGGIRDYYPGTCLREETDPVLRIGSAGWTVLYSPSAIVRHVAGPYAKGRRFDTRYKYFDRRNHIVLLMTVFGVTSPYLRRYLRFIGAEATQDLRSSARRVLSAETFNARARASFGGTLRIVAALAGALSGLIAGVRAVSSESRRVDAN